MTGSPPAPQAVTGPVGSSPLRRPRSLRRTSTIDMEWMGQSLVVDGRARDLFTGRDLSSTVVSSAQLNVTLSADRTITEISTVPEHREIEQLIGTRASGRLRTAVGEVVPGERAAGSPLHHLLDDLVGASLVSAFVVIRWENDSVAPHIRSELPNVTGPMPEGVCLGFAPGSRSLIEQLDPNHIPRVAPVAPLAHPSDPDGWHVVGEPSGIEMRRARRLDLWRTEHSIEVEAFFSDSGRDPNGSQIGVHQYIVGASVHPDSLILTDLRPDPRILPFLECPMAATKALGVVGTPVGELRPRVTELLSHTNGCTHLNDIIRSFADLPMLIDQLDNSS